MVLVVVAPPEVAVVLAVVVVVVVLPPEAVPVPVPVPTAWLKRNSNVIKRKKGPIDWDIISGKFRKLFVDYLQLWWCWLWYW